MDDEEEMRYFFILNDFSMLFRAYKPAQVLYDLKKYYKIYLKEENAD